MIDFIKEKSIFVALNGCDETGSGSIDSPFQSLHHAQKVVKPGETVYFREGVYHVPLTDLNVIYSKGKPDAWITFKNFENEKVVFDGGGRGMIIASFPNLLTLYKAEYVIIDGFECQNLWGNGITNFDTFHTIIRNCITHDFNARGIGGSGRFNTYEYNDVFHSCMSNADFHGEKRTGWAAGLSTILRPYFIPSTNIIIRHNKVHENWGEGIDSFLANDVEITDNEVYDNYSVNIYGDTTKNLLIANNRVNTRNKRYFRDNKPANGVQISNEGSETTKFVNPNTCLNNITIENNSIDGTYCGIEYWEDVNNDWETNTYHNIKIIGNTIKNCWLADVNFDKVSAQNVTPPHDCKMNDNIFHKTKVNKYLIMGDSNAWEFNNNKYMDGTPFVNETFPKEAL